MNRTMPRKLELEQSSVGGQSGSGAITPQPLTNSTNPLNTLIPMTAVKTIAYLLTIVVGTIIAQAVFGNIIWHNWILYVALIMATIIPILVSYSLGKSSIKILTPIAVGFMAIWLIWTFVQSFSPTPDVTIKKIVETKRLQSQKQITARKIFVQQKVLDFGDLDINIEKAGQMSQRYKVPPNAVLTIISHKEGDHTIYFDDGSVFRIKNGENKKIPAKNEPSFFIAAENDNMAFTITVMPRIIL
jgi:hypothetical protein